MKEKEKVKITGEAQVQPHDDNTEIAVLATLMRYNAKFSEYSDLLTEEMFYRDKNKAIYQCIAGVITENKVSDVKALFDYAKTHEIVYPLEELSFLEIVKFVSVDTLSQDISRLRRMWKQRKLWVELQLASQKVLDPIEDFDEVVNETMSRLGDIQNDMADSGIYSFDESVGELKEIVNDNAKGKRKSLVTGFKLFDEHFLLRPTTLTIIAAFTGVGKSSIAMNIAMNTANLGNGVAYYSLEMGKSELAARAISGKAGISSSVIVNCKLEEYQLQQFDRAVGETGGLPIYIDERATVSFDNTIKSIRTLVRTKNIKLAVIDYLQIYSQVGNSVEASLAYMARSAKNIAKECGIAVILLSQLSRGSSHPSINQLRGSGQIEESADNIVLIDRPEAYPNNTIRYEGDFSDQDTHGTAKLILAKGRGVGTGNALVGFDGRFTQFYELDDKPQVEDNTPF
jgi:replicative DNA helicase